MKKKDELSKKIHGPQPGLTRRELTRGALGAAGWVLLAGVVPPQGRAEDHEQPEIEHEEKHEEEAQAPELVSDFPENELLLSQVKYVAVSEVEGKQCGNCALLIARDGAYGRCGLFQKGQVHVTGWCTSYIYKPGA